MKRKKFIKALGAYGIQRNAATLVADITRANKKEYAKVLETFKNLNAHESKTGFMSRHAGKFVFFHALAACSDRNGIGADISFGKDMTATATFYPSGDTVHFVTTFCGRNGGPGNE